MTRDEAILLGTIAKTYGVHGEMILRFEDPSLDPDENWESLFLKIDGILVPFFISSLRPLRSGEWILKLDWYEDKTQAASLVGYDAWIPAYARQGKGEEIYLDELTGFKFRDAVSGKEGTIREFLDIRENPVFEVETEGERKLIPAREEFVIEVDPGDCKILFRLPEGLI